MEVQVDVPVVEVVSLEESTSIVERESITTSRKVKGITVVVTGQAEASVSLKLRFACLQVVPVLFILVNNQVIEVDFKNFSN